MDIAEIAGRAREFRAHLDAVRHGIGRPVEWYPYPSLSNFEHLNGILTGERRRLLELAAGRPVLDLGCADGDIAFFLESLGCEVHAVDHPMPNHNGMEGVRALKAALGSGVAIHETDLDGAFDLPAADYGLALFLGTLYHVRNPFRVLEKLATHVRHCVLSTRIAQCLPGGGRIEDQPVAYLLDRDELNADDSNYWIFSEAGLRRLLKRTGWEALDWGTRGATDGSDPVDRDQRAFCLLRSCFTLAEGWHAREGGAWRWTARTFSAELPRRRSFELRVHVPAVMVQRFGSVTLRALADGVELAPETWRAAGDYVYRRRIPAGAGERVRLEFRLSEALPPDEQDRRERGIIVNALEVR
jgi:SAM-dependent methyltransferase